MVLPAIRIGFVRFSESPIAAHPVIAISIRAFATVSTITRKAWQSRNPALTHMTSRTHRPTRTSCSAHAEIDSTDPRARPAEKRDKKANASAPNDVFEGIVFRESHSTANRGAQKRCSEAHRSDSCVKGQRGLEGRERNERLAFFMFVSVVTDEQCKRAAEAFAPRRIHAVHTVNGKTQTRKR